MAPKFSQLGAIFKNDKKEHETRIFWLNRDYVISHIKMKKNKIFLICSGVCAIVGIIVITLFLYNYNEGFNQNTNTTDDTKDFTREPIIETEPTLPKIPENVAGIPGDTFEATLGRDWDFTIKNNDFDKEYTLTHNIACSTITDNLIDVVAEMQNNPELHIPPDDPLKPGSLELKVYAFESDDSGIFVFGCINNEDKDLYFKDCEMVYVHYQGTAKWSIMGATIGMTKNELVEAIGSPTQSYEMNDGYVMDYYVYRDSHSYVLTVYLDSIEGSVYKIAVNIDNHPVVG